MSAPDVFVAGTGYTVLGLIRSLGKAGIPCRCLSIKPAVERYSRWYAGPLTTDQKADGNGEQLGELLAGIRRPALLFCCSDHFTRQAAELPDELTTSVKPIVPSKGSLLRLQDKLALAQTCEKVGVPHPASVPVTSEAEIERLPESFFTTAFLKPINSQSFFARHNVKGIQVASKADARTQFLSLADASEGGLLLQQYVSGPPGNHLFLEGYVGRSGELLALFARRRERIFPPDFGNSTSAVSLPLKEAGSAVAAIESLLDATGYRGIFSAEFKRNESGIPYLIEVNTRPWWHIEHATLCGMNIAAIACADFCGQPLVPVRTYRTGVRFIHHALDRYAAAAEIAAGRLHRRELIWQRLTAYPLLFRWSDPLPSVGELNDRFRVRLRKTGQS